MKRLYLTVEGQTEQGFVTDVLRPHLEAFNVFVTKPRLTGLNSRRKANIPKGGLLSRFARTLGDIQTWLKEDKSNDARFTMMVDLYGLPNDFPGYNAISSITDVYQKVYHLEDALAKELNDARFIPYLQLHEFEALVLADVDALGDWLSVKASSLRSLKNECCSYPSPEHINDGQHSHPKYRIKKYCPDYAENIDGPEVIDLIGLQVIRQKCQHFNEWLSTLERLDI